MEFTNTFTIPVGIDEAFATLTDLEKVAPCMPGAKLETVDGDVYTGRVKVKVGPMSLTYKGKAELVEKDDDAHTARIEARGSEARGGGTANADVTAALTEVEDGTEVVVTTAIDITGKPAQFGRGVMGDVGKKIIDTFADCLARKFDQPEPSEDDDGGTDAAGAASSNGSSAASDASSNDASGDQPMDDTMDGGETGVTPEGSAADAPAAATPAQAAAASVQTAEDTAASVPAAPSTGPRRVADTEPEVEALDLMDVAGESITKRVVPVAAGLGLIALLVWLFTRRGN